MTPSPPSDGGNGWAAIWYAAKDALNGVLFAFRLGSDETSRVFPLAGLVAEKGYRVSLMSAGSILDVTGEALARGVNITIPGPFESELVLVEVQ